MTTSTTTPPVRVQTISITFPEIRLKVRDAHKLRGYFGNLFRERSPLLHQHYAEGEIQLRYPLVQYKVVDNIPTLVGFGEGARLLTELFLEMQELIIDDHTFPIRHKNISAHNALIGLNPQLIFYKFKTLWMPLNQTNYHLYKNYEPAQQLDQLKGIAISNILAIYKTFGLRLAPDERIQVALKLNPKETAFKNTNMLAFDGTLVTNAMLPPYIGIGKSVARGFGVLTAIDDF